MTPFEEFLQVVDYALRLELIADVPQPFYTTLMYRIEQYAQRSKAKQEATQG
jgi:hypothetical protein